MVDLKTELSSNQTTLLLMPNTSYNSVIVDTMKQLSNESVCYITLNKTSDSLKEIFNKQKINMDNVIFVDAISKTLKKTPDTDEGIYFVSSPGALTELSLVINKFLKHKFDYLVFDSITNLKIYNKSPICAKFMTNLINKIKKTQTKAVFYAVGSKDDEVVKDTSMLVDKVIDTEKKESTVKE